MSHPFSSILSPVFDAFPFFVFLGIHRICYPVFVTLTLLSRGCMEEASNPPSYPRKQTFFSSDTVGKGVCGVGRGGDCEEDEVVSVGHQVAAGEVFFTSFSFRCDSPN